MSTKRPYYRRPVRSPDRTHQDFKSTGEFIDLTNAHLDPYELKEPVAKARALFDARAAAVVSTAVALDGAMATSDPNEKGPVSVWPGVDRLKDGGYTARGFRPRSLLEMKSYKGKAPTVVHPTRKCLPTMAYLDFFPERQRIGKGLRAMVSGAVLAANPGWCGSLGPGQDNTFETLFGGHTEGNYDMTQMGLLPLAYQFYDELSPEARVHLVTNLLAAGRIHRTSLPEELTSGRAPSDWDRAGYVSAPFYLDPFELTHKNIGETENHIIMIAATRYLTNQLLFQRDPRDEFDNRRNGGENRRTCISILLELMRNILGGDFSEYNSKPYQTETRWALLNLCTYAYDHEVRLAARMVLDYISAHIAVSSNDLRRMVPFRRRNEKRNVDHDQTDGHMTVGLLEVGDANPMQGADPMVPNFAMQAGNTRAFEFRYPNSTGTPPWAILDDGAGLSIEVLSDYRLPPSIHDLFVTDAHRRFFQKVHRTVRAGEMGGHRNCDNMEIYASSPSYLITAGGRPSDYAIDPRYAGQVIKPGDNRQQLGVAVTTSFMPTGSGPPTATGLVDRSLYPVYDASKLIQFGQFVQGGVKDDPARSYGVAPDFAFGHSPYLPPWLQFARMPDGFQEHGFRFVDKSRRTGQGPGPGFFLAIFQENGLGLLEAFDTWLHPTVTFLEFAEDVVRRNPDVRLRKDELFHYTTSNGNRLDGMMWWRNGADFGAEIRTLDHGERDPRDAKCDGGDVKYRTISNADNRFLFGTVMNSPAEAVVEVTNPFLCTTITLDMSDVSHPRRISESGEVEASGFNNEVWLDFESTRQAEGDVCRPFHSVSAAAAAVAPGGTIKIVPGATTDRSTIAGNKPMRLVAPIGGVIIGARRIRAGRADGFTDDEDPVRKDDTWVQFDDRQFDEVGLPAGPFNTIPKAAAAVKAGGVIRIVPGWTADRPTIGNGKSFRLVAPIGGVVIGGWVSRSPWFSLPGKWKQSPSPIHDP